MAGTFIGDPFAELGVSPAATLDEVKRAFRQRARETHPDVQPGDPQAARRFARLRAAYELALEQVQDRDREPVRPQVEAHHHPRRGRGLTEHELAARINRTSDTALLRRVLQRHGYRPFIAVALARNPAFPTDALETLRQQTEQHWTVEAAIADRADVPRDMLLAIARLAREPVVGLAVVGNAACDSEILDALVAGPVRMEPALENALSLHPDLSVLSATRLASRYSTSGSAVTRLIDRGDLPEALLWRLANQNGRPQIAAAARGDLRRRGLPVPIGREPHRPPRSMSGSW
ncbi:MAG TPA: DnaJ domain-containing protein [Chloroflexota bacterium]|nr:DnaJ domain-containing protein [Chloroflexota bacterium]